MIPDWTRERQRMVDEQLRRRGITDERVLAAMLEIPRQEFVPIELRVISYRDDPIAIGFGQTISQPYMTALMAQSLELKGTEVILDVGAGSGYAAAVLGALGARVIAIELIAGLALLAAQNLQRTGRAANVQVVTGDGSVGGFASSRFGPTVPVAAASFRVWQLLQPAVSKTCLPAAGSPVSFRTACSIGSSAQRKKAGCAGNEASSIRCASKPTFYVLVC